MYRYSSEHALMDYHLNPEKKVQEETPQTEKKENETDTIKTE